MQNQYCVVIIYIPTVHTYKLQAGCLLQGPNLLTPIELVKASLDVAKGAKYLEALKFIHRSAAPSNLLSTLLMTPELH